MRVFKIVIFITHLVYSIWFWNFLSEIAEPRLSDTDDELNDTDGEVDDKTDAFNEGASSGALHVSYIHRILAVPTWN